MLFDFEGTCTTAAKLSVSNITKIIMTMTYGLHSSVIEIMEVFFSHLATISMVSTAKHSDQNN